MGLDFVLCETDGAHVGVLSDRLPVADVTLAPSPPPGGIPRPNWGKYHVGGSRLQGPQSAKFSLYADDPMAALITPFGSYVKVYLDGELIFVGPITLPRFTSGDGGIASSFEYVAIGAPQRLEQLHLRDWPYSVGTINATTGEWAMRIIEDADANRAGGAPACGVVAGAVDSTDMNTGAWRRPKDGDDAWAAINNLTKVADGAVEIRFTPVDRDNGEFWELDSGASNEQLGTDRSTEVFYEYNLGRHTVAQLVHEAGNGTLINRAIVLPGGDATSAVVGIAAHTVSQQAFGMYGTVLTGPDDGDATQLANIAKRIVAAGRQLSDHVQIVPTAPAGSEVFAYMRDETGALVGGPAEGYGAPPRFAPAGDCWLGDWVRIIGRDGAFELDVAARIVGAVISTPDASGTVATELTLDPAIDDTGLSSSSPTFARIAKAIGGPTPGPLVADRSVRVVR